ncbi:hypothetical protein ACIQXP_00215 [Pedobacter suwonensis]|uniref:hypothetical protein n=1 Tax=Pedobacter suwonensis TaxID=332999 RepID=UPI00367F716A
MLSASRYLHPATGLADFRRKKHGNLCTTPSYHHNPRQDQSGSGGISQAESLDAAAIKISVAFYKELRSNLLYR